MTGESFLGRANGSLHYHTLVTSGRVCIVIRANGQAVLYSRPITKRFFLFFLSPSHYSTLLVLIFSPQVLHWCMEIPVGGQEPEVCRDSRRLFRSSSCRSCDIIPSPHRPNRESWKEKNKKRRKKSRGSSLIFNSRSSITHAFERCQTNRHLGEHTV